MRSREESSGASRRRSWRCSAGSSRGGWGAFRRAKRSARSSRARRREERAILALEVASGTGEHAAFLAEHLPGLVWQPSDIDPSALASIDAYRREAGLDNLRSPLDLDASSDSWPLIEPACAVVCINMIHISPWAACAGLLRGAARALKPGGALYLYGPYRIDGGFTAPSNEDFDASLRRRDPAWGVRDLDAVTELAAVHGLTREAVIPMPANNHSVIFRRPV